MALRCVALVTCSLVPCLSIAAPPPQAPLYEECRLDSVFPSGGQRGTRVTIEMKGFKRALSFLKDIVIDGPPGVTVKELKSINGSTAEATLDITPDAPLGRRWIRILNEHSGLTNFAHFVVGSLSERLDAEPNNDTANAQPVELPLVVNGRVTPAADIDLFRFSGKKGQRLVAAIAAHALDVHGQGRNYGIADFSLELLDAQGRTLAAAEDTLGFDPLIEHVLPNDGEYFVRVQLLNYQGFLEAVYRLTLGEVPYVTGVFPPGYRRGISTEIELFGPHIASGTKRLVGQTATEAFDGALAEHKWFGEEGAAWDRAYPLRYLAIDRGPNSGLDVPIVVGDFPEFVEAEPNNDRLQAALFTLPVTVNARFHQPGDADWYRVRLEAKQKVQCEIMAHRFLRSPVDTLLQVFDAQGKLLIENDDEAFDIGYESYHDFRTTDSKLAFTAPEAEEYFVKVTEQSGEHGPRAVYRLTVEDERPEFRLSHFPDAVPIWGPGSSACVLVRIDRFGGCNDDVELAIEGLPAGWSSSTATSLASVPERPFNTYQLKVFLTLTAPADAAVGTCVPFRIVGRAKRADGKTLEHTSLPLTLYYTTDTGFFRASPLSRAAVAKSQGPWLEAVTSEVAIVQGQTGSIKVKVHGAGEVKEMPIVVNLAMAGVACNLGTPQNLPIQDGLVAVPIKIAPEVPPGTYGITVAQTWRSDIRIGMPGPCTRLVKLTVLSTK
jgi:hypothetical protein